MVLAPRYTELVEDMASANDSPEMRERVHKAREVASVYASYCEVKKQNGRIDFGDLVALPTDLLERRADIIRDLRATYKHILVDEYQDVNRASVRLLQQLTNGGRNLWCVGDVRQSIYRFRGASSFNLGQFDTEDFPDGERNLGRKVAKLRHSARETVYCWVVWKWLEAEPESNKSNFLI